MSALTTPRVLRTGASIQSTKYCAPPVRALFHTLAGWLRARARCAAVMAPVSTMASSTRAVRSAERCGWFAGSYSVGDFGMAASMAASRRVSARAGLLK